MKRRTFLKLSAATLGTAVLGRLHSGLAQEAKQELIVVSNAGNADAGVMPSISLIEPSSLQVLATLAMPSSYSFPATRWDFGRNVIWTGLPAGPNNAVNAFRLSTGEQIAEVPTGSTQNYTELTPDGRYVVVAARFMDKFLKISADPQAPDFGSVVAELDHYAGSNPCDITISSDGAYAYAPDRGGDTVSAVRLDPFEVVVTVPMERLGNAALEPFMGTVSPTSNYLFIENAQVRGGPDAGSESVFDLSDPGRPVEIVRLSQADGLGSGPITSEFTADGRYGIVICRGSSNLSIVDTASLEITENVAFPEGSNPLTGTFAGAGDTFFVPLPGRDAVAAVSVPDFDVVELIPVGQRPLGVIYLSTSLPERQSLHQPLGQALASGRAFAPDCPDRCCGQV
jgi:DNA-binding beta-propeller fold protein YncE